MGKQPHTVTARGRWVRVELKPKPGELRGEVFEGRFLERTRRKVLVFEGGRRVPAGEVIAFSDRRLLQPISRHKK